MRKIYWWEIADKIICSVGLGFTAYCFFSEWVLQALGCVAATFALQFGLELLEQFARE